MATRKTKTGAKAGKAVADNQLAQAVTQSAQKIWLAGLGAFARARTEGDKLFDLLVEQGKAIARQERERGRPGAEERAFAGRRDDVDRAGQVGQARAGIRGSGLPLPEPPRRAHEQGRRRTRAAGIRAQRKRACPDGRRGAEARPPGDGEEDRVEEGPREEDRTRRRRNDAGRAMPSPPEAPPPSLSAPRRPPGTEGCSRPAKSAGLFSPLARHACAQSRVTRSTSFT